MGVALVVVGARVLRGGGGADSLRTALDDMAEPAQFSARHVPLAPSVLDCFVRSRVLLVEVDLERRSMRIGAGEGRELARRIGDDVYVSPAGLGTTGETWYEDTAPAAPERRRPLLDMLGVDVVGYLYADALPSGPVASARELARGASVVESVDAARHRLVIDDIPDVGAVSAEIVLRGAGVREIVVRPATEEAGWRVEYSAGTSLDLRVPAALRPLDEAERVGGATADCAVSL